MRGIPALLRIAYVSLALNLSLLGGMMLVRSEDPVKHVRLTTRADGIIIFGQNRFGLLSLKIFPTWTAAENYMHRRGLERPHFNFVEQRRGVEAVAERGNPQLTFYKVFWNLEREQPPCLYAPDAISAVEMADYIRFQGVLPSPLGPSLPLAVPN